VRAWLLSLILLLAAWGGRAEGPHEIAAKDLPGVRPADRPYQRYLDLRYLTDEKALLRWDAVLRFWEASTSREADFVPPARVTAWLWRVDLRDNRWAVEVWEKLAALDPWYTQKQVTLTGGKKVTKYVDHPGGDCYNPETKRTIKNLARGRYSFEVEEGGSKVVKAAAGFWVPKEAFAYLSTETRSQLPVVRLDWFLSRIAVASDDGAGYYDFLGVGNDEADFLALGGVDVQKARDLRKEIGALVSRSDVTLNNRALERYQGITGAFWRSRDFDKNTDVKNALRLLDDDIQEAANEEYIETSLGMYAFGLFDAKKKRQNAAPDSIASDGKAPGTDRRVKAGISCVRCHVEGIRPIKDWARAVYQPPFALEDKLFAEQKRKRAKYLSDLQGQVAEDQARYARALKKINGLTPAANAEAVAKAFADYTERDRSLAGVAAELGLDKDRLLAALKARARQETLDPVLAALVQGLDVRVEHLEELVPLLYEVYGEYTP
jgi:hypothetical protein